MNALSRLQSGEVETVMVGFTDMYGRFMGKRFTSEFFLEDCMQNGTHICDYLMACDMEMDPITGFKLANWERGFGDFHLVPDMSTLRVASWLPKTAMVMCDVQHNGSHDSVDEAPRSVLRKQIAAMNASGYNALAATELEYYTYLDSFEVAAKKDYKDLENVSQYVEDYHLLQGTREEDFQYQCRKHLKESGIPVENSKGEAGIGQHELNVRYTDILHMADRHAVYKQCVKEIAQQLGQSVTFMAKPYTDATGSGCHVHLSLWDADNSNNVFVGNQSTGPIKNTSDLFRWFLGGWIKHTPDCMVFYAPTVNSYKRYQAGSWAPTRLAWSNDNRTAGFRIVGSGKSLRIESRIPGADVNPYLILAASLASGLEGIKNKIEPPAVFEGNVYEAQSIPEVPKSLHEAVERFRSSAWAKEAFGENVVEHYAHWYDNEQKTYDKQVSEWERKRYFERI